MICRLCFLPWWYRVTPNDTFGLSLCPLTPMCGRLGEKWRSLAIARFPAEKCNKRDGNSIKINGKGAKLQHHPVNPAVLFPWKCHFIRRFPKLAHMTGNAGEFGIPGKGNFGRSIFEPGSALLHLLLRERETERVTVRERERERRQSAIMSFQLWPFHSEAMQTMTCKYPIRGHIRHSRH